MKPVLSAAAVCLFLAACASEQSGPIRIGAVISTSGPQQQHSTIGRGMTMAAAEINELGGVNGRPVEIVITDAASSLAGARKGFASLEADGAPIAYVTATSGMSLALAPLAEKHKVPLIGLITTSPDFSRTNEWCFRYWTSSELLVPPVLKILKSIKVKDVAVLYQDDELGNSVLNVFQPAAEAQSVKVEPVPFGLKENDLASYIASHDTAQAIYIVAFTGKTKTALKEIRRLNYDGHVITFSSGAAPAVRAMPETDGTYTISSRILDVKFPFAKEVRDRYEKQFGDPIDHRVASGYDAVKLLAALLKNVPADRDALRAALSGGFVYPGVFGDVDVSPGERDFLLPMEAARIRDGNLVFLE